MNAWLLPTSATIGGTEYPINADFRDVLEIISYLTDTSKPTFVRWGIAVSLFYDGEIPDEYQGEAMQYLADFISYGEKPDKPTQKLLDWDKDAQLIVGDVNKVAGKEIRSLPFLHWWTFLSYFYGIGEGQLSTVVSIRDKKKRGKKLSDWEKEYYKNNKERIDGYEKKFERSQEEKDELRELFGLKK